jgi:hypothetical protein
VQYLLLIYSDRSVSETWTKEERQAVAAGYRALTTSLQQDGRYIGANQLAPVSVATTVRVNDGKTLITDGPFAETKEQLIGYYLVDCEHLDDALEVAARIPAASHGAIEVRPVMQS